METITHEYFVSLEVAKLLKKAGFDWECRKIYYCYREDDDTWELEDNYKIHKHILELDYCLLAPTLDVAQRWLREVKGILLYITPKRVNMEWKWDFWYIDLRDKTNIEQRYSTKNFNTYEEAQEAGIKKTLEIIVK